MPSCCYCRNSGWLLSVDDHGLCAQCQKLILPAVTDLCRAVRQSVGAIAKTKNLSVQLSHIDTAQKCCERLAVYHDMGIPTFTDHPRNVAEELAQRREIAIEQFVDAQLFDAREKAFNAPSDTAKLRGYLKALRRLSVLLNDVQDVTPIKAAMVAIQFELDGVRFDLLERKAEAALAKGQRGEALDHYVDAALCLKHDRTPDQYQQDRLERARSKIIELGGTPPL